MKTQFSELFEIRNRLIRPKVTVELCGVTLHPGKLYDDGASMTGINLLEHRESSFDIEKQDGKYVIKTIYE